MRNLKISIVILHWLQPPKRGGLRADAVVLETLCNSLHKIVPSFSFVWWESYAWLMWNYEETTANRLYRHFSLIFLTISRWIRHFRISFSFFWYICDIWKKIHRLSYERCYANIWTGSKTDRIPYYQKCEKHLTYPI